jgi:hypothetical protein
MTNIIIPDEVITSKIYLIRGLKVMIDKDLAVLYGVTTGNLNKAVKRNFDRFPEDFMFQITVEEYDSLKFQIGILKRGEHSKYLPYAFTEQGVAMLSSVLNSKQAIMVNIQIIRIFTRMRQMLLTHKDILLKLEKLEKEVSGHDEKIKLIFEYLKQLLIQPKQERTQIGFKQNKK